MNKLLTLLFWCSIAMPFSFAQINLDVEGTGIISDKLAVGTNAIDAKAQTQIDATDAGLLIPRMNTAARIVISSTGAATMPEGLLVYDTDDQQFYYWDASIPDWNAVATGGGATAPQSLTFDPNTGMLGISDGNMVTLTDTDPLNEIELPTGGAIGQVLTTDGAGNHSWAYVSDTDADVTNELNTGVALNGTSLEVTDAGGILSTDLSSLQDGVTDADADSSNELITGGTLDGTNLEIMEAGNTTTVDLSALAGGGDVDWYTEQTTDSPTAISDHIYTDGNVGIGVNNPLTPLHVIGAARANQGIFGVASFGFTTNNAELRLIDWFDDDNSMLEFGKANSDGSTWYMNVTRQADGTPTYPLDQGEMAFQIYNNKWKDYSTNVAITDDYPPHLHLSRDVRRYIGIFTDHPTTQLDVDGQIRMREGATNNYIIQGDADGLMSWTDPASLFTEVDGSTTNETITGAALNGTSLDITEAGATTMVDLSGLSEADWYTANTVSNPTSIENSIYTNGSVGVGTDNPAVEIHVVGDGSMLNLEGTTHSYIQYYKTGLANGRSAYAGFGSSGSNIFSIQNETTGTTSDIIRIAAEDGIYVSGGNTATPYSMLDVNGQITMRSGATDGYILRGDANGTMSWVDPNTISGGAGFWSEDATNGYLFPSTITNSVGVGLVNPVHLHHVKHPTKSGVSSTTIASKSEINSGGLSSGATIDITGFQGRANANSWSATSVSTGIHGLAVVSGTGNSPTHTAVGVRGEASAETNGTQTAIGGFFTASGGDNNYAIETDQGDIKFGGMTAGTLTADANGVISARDMLKVPIRTTYPSSPEIGDIIHYDDGTASPGNHNLYIYTQYGWLSIFTY